jgi:serine O-acetyltransferase
LEIDFLHWLFSGKSPNALVSSYAKAGGINHMDGKNLPSKRAVTAITQDLLRMLFPGFFDEQPIHSSEIKVVTAALLDGVLGKLEDEIRKSLEYLPPAGMSKSQTTAAAHALTVKFLGNLPRVREILQTDVEAAFNGDPAGDHRLLPLRGSHRNPTPGA